MNSPGNYSPARNTRPIWRRRNRPLGQQPDAELTEKYQKLMGILSLNQEVMTFIQAEYRINQVMGDIFKILSEAVDMQLDFLSE